MAFTSGSSAQEIVLLTENLKRLNPCDLGIAQLSRSIEQYTHQANATDITVDIIRNALSEGENRVSLRGCDSNFCQQMQLFKVHAARKVKEFQEIAEKCEAIRASTNNALLQKNLERVATAEKKNDVQKEISSLEECKMERNQELKEAQLTTEKTKLEEKELRENAKHTEKWAVAISYIPIVGSIASNFLNERANDDREKASRLWDKKNGSSSWSGQIYFHGSLAMLQAEINRLSREVSDLTSLCERLEQTVPMLAVLKTKVEGEVGNWRSLQYSCEEFCSQLETLQNIGAIHLPTNYHSYSPPSFQNPTNTN